MNYFRTIPVSRSFLLLSFSVLLSFYAGAVTRRVFFIGNSYTYTNNMPDMLRDFTTAQGDTLIYSMSAPGGYTFLQHTSLAATLSGIAAQPWDIIVLQEQSQLPSFAPSQVETDVYPYARRLDSTINDHDSCIETMFMMTWGRKNGDATNCASYPVVCTYAGMQSRLRDSYMEMAQDNHASVAPMGAAWKVVIDSFPAIDLYQADESHPSVAGSYLQACVFYASVFHRSAQGCTYISSLSPSVAATLQRIADKVVLDSMSQWQQNGHYPYAAFTYAHTSSSTVTFTNGSQRASVYEWNFGDGSAVSSATSPSHIYTADGVYTVSLTVTNDCFTERKTDTVHIGAVLLSVNELQDGGVLRVSYTGGGNTVFFLPAGTDGVLEVADMAGRVIRSYAASGSEIHDNFPAGIYLYRYTAEGNILTGKFSSY